MLATGERCVKAMEASGPARVRMCYVGASRAFPGMREGFGVDPEGMGLNVELFGVCESRPGSSVGVRETEVLIVSPRIGQKAGGREGERPCTICAHLILKLYPARKRVGRWIVLFHVFCKKSMPKWYLLAFAHFLFIVRPQMCH